MISPVAAPVDVLRGVPLFSELGDRELERLAGHFKERTFPEGSAVTMEGGTGTGFFVVVEGNATVSVSGEQRGTLGPGDSFGEIALLRDVPRTATVRATADATLVSLAQDEFLSAVTGHTDSSAAVEAVVTSRIGAA